MRTKGKTLTYCMAVDRFTARFAAASQSEDEFASVYVCKGTARTAFDIGIKRKIDFVITNVKPKALSDWHILKKDKWSDWMVVSTEQTEGLYYETQQEIEKQFPNNKTLYVSAYA